MRTVYLVNAYANNAGARPREWARFATKAEAQTHVAQFGAFYGPTRIIEELTLEDSDTEEKRKR